jgi:hypothetical protein
VHSGVRGAAASSNAAQGCTAAGKRRHATRDRRVTRRTHSSWTAASSTCTLATGPSPRHPHAHGAGTHPCAAPLSAAAPSRRV